MLLFLCGVLIGYITFFYIEKYKENKDNTSSDGEDMRAEILISEEEYADLKQLKSFVDYAIQKYCEEKGIENSYTYQLLRNMLHHDTRIKGENKYTYDLNRRISPQLTNDRFTFKMSGQYNTIFVVIDTYRMKMYVYEDIEGEIYVVEGNSSDREAELYKGEALDDCVISDWEDMWELEYNEYVSNGWQYLTMPEFDERTRINPELYGMVIYSLRRYCEENNIEEMFYFQFPRDKVSNVTSRVFTVKVEGDFRTLYMDIDMDRNKVHVYEVEE